MRYILPALLLLALLPPRPARANDAETLFRAMEKKITQARAFKVAVTVDTQGDTKDRAGSFRGFLLLTRDHKARLKMSGVEFSESRRWQMVSNGKQVKLRPYDVGVSEVFKEEATFATAKNLHNHLAMRVSRLGVFLLAPWGRTAVLLGGADPEVWGFQAGARVKIDGRDVRVVRFKMGSRDQVLGSAAFTLWIDTRTLLPLKRVIVLDPKSKAAVTETYKEFTLDPKIDAAAFQLAFPVNEAEKLFRAMQEKIKAAKAVQAAFTIEIKANGKAFKGQASVLFTKENQARLKVTVDEMGKKITTEMISDGKHLKYAQSPETIARAEAERTPATLSKRCNTVVSGPGLLLTYELLNGTYPLQFKRVASETGGKDKVGGRDARVVTYLVAGFPADYQVTLWIDARTLLPLKRLTVLVGEERTRIIEISHFKLDPKIDAEAFRLPK